MWSTRYYLVPVGRLIHLLSDSTGDTVNDSPDLRDIYMISNPHFEGAVTVPVLWDRKSHRIVNNESAEIIRMFNSEFQNFASQSGR